jgi:hypothetical protein
MDDAILNRIARVRAERIWYNPTPELLIERYLSLAAADRLKAMILEPRGWCPPQVLAYFFRAQPETAEAILKRTPWHHHQPVDVCFGQWFSGLPERIYPRILEDYLIFHLMHESPSVKWVAAGVLSRHGTLRARQPIEDAYDYFHEYWKGKEPELENPDYRDGRMLESALRASIAQGQAWFTDEATLQEQADACMTTQCRSQSAEDIAQWQRLPLRLELLRRPSGELFARIAHYRAVIGMKAVQEKLAQFPSGTQFTLQISLPPSDRERLATELREFAAKSGLIIQ